jgi:glycerophosphoryl diester phosphodiesterase
MFECDVKPSADDVLFLLHDATLERTTDGKGDARALPRSALATLDEGLPPPRPAALQQGQPLGGKQLHAVSERGAGFASRGRRTGLARPQAQRPPRGAESYTQ